MALESVKQVASVAALAPSANGFHMDDTQQGRDIFDEIGTGVDVGSRGQKGGGSDGNKIWYGRN